jgi:indolepyruvate ferredoxin oxidoreductase beta subunit
MKENIQNILICGIGGQGVVLAGKIISVAAFESGLDIKTSEVHGMSQRGGSVSTHIRIGEKIFSPLIPKNKASIILSFDIYETVRYIRSFANVNTVIISSEYGKMPVWTTKDKKARIREELMSAQYIADFLKANFKSLRLINDKKIAEDIGNIKISNIVSIGLLSNFTQIEEKTWLKAVKNNVPAITADLNIKAFLAGRGNYGNKIF